MGPKKYGFGGDLGGSEAVKRCHVRKILDICDHMFGSADFCGGGSTKEK